MVLCYHADERIEDTKAEDSPDVQPIFRRVAEMALKYRGLTPKGTEGVDLAKLASEPDPAHLTYAALREARGIKPNVQEVKASAAPHSGQVRVPDMTGWPLREALRKSIELGAIPQVRGTGLLAKQKPPPGEVLTKGGALLLEFEPAS